jgi:hypothetical protein
MNEEKLSERAKEINLALENEMKLKFLEYENVEFESLLVKCIKRLKFRAELNLIEYFTF